MDLVTWVIIIAGIDLLGRILCLVYLINNNNVRCLTYRTWVLLVAFLNFAWVFYLILAFKAKNNKL